VNDIETHDHSVHKRILIVEDSPVQVFALVKLLESKGLKTICAPNGRAGVQMAQQCHPDLIILDVQMPEMDGLEACKALKQDPSTAPIPIIFLTGHTQSEVFITGIQEGAIDFVPKDAFSEIVLLRTLEQLNFIAPDGSDERF